MLSNEMCPFLDPFTDEKWAYPNIPRSFWPAKPMEGGPELLKDQLDDWAEARGDLAAEWAKARAEASPETQMEQLNLDVTEQKIDANEGKAKPPAMRLAELTNLSKHKEKDAGNAQRDELMKKYLDSQMGMFEFWGHQLPQHCPSAEYPFLDD
jgi:hypothetical protein